MEEFVQSLVQGGLSLLEAIFTWWWGLLGIGLDWFIGQFKDFLIWLEPMAVEVLRGIFTPIFELVDATPWFFKMPVLFGLLAAVLGLVLGVGQGLLELLMKPTLYLALILLVLTFLPLILGLIVFGIVLVKGTKEIKRQFVKRKKHKELSIGTAPSTTSP